MRRRTDIHGFEVERPMGRFPGDLDQLLDRSRALAGLCLKGRVIVRPEIAEEFDVCYPIHLAEPACSPAECLKFIRANARFEPIQPPAVAIGEQEFVGEHQPFELVPVEQTAAVDQHAIGGIATCGESLLALDELAL